MKLKPNNDKGISFNRTTMSSLEFIAPPPSPPPNYFGLKFLDSLPKIRGAATMIAQILNKKDLKF